MGNLAPTLTEESLTEHFRKFGEIYSVKIMWPRTEVCGYQHVATRMIASDGRQAAAAVWWVGVLWAAR